MIQKLNNQEIKMKCNMGTTDRIIRIGIGTIFTIYAIIEFNPIIIIPCIVIAYTVGKRWCILYHFLGINTGCDSTERNAPKGTRGSIVEGLAVSSVFFLIAVILYLILRYITF